MKGGVNVSKREGKDYLYLIWKDPTTRRNYVVGQLSKNSQFEFTYGFEIKDAIKKGFELLTSFEDMDKVYKSDTLFPTFSSRLPDHKRRDIGKILSKYDLKEYNEYKLLKRSGARLPIDNLEFIDPLLPEDSNKGRIFDIAGIRHYIGCDGKECKKAINLNVGDELILVREPKNDYDKYAIKILDKFDNLIGYIPRYYSKSLTNYLKAGKEYRCTVFEVNKDMKCNECVKAKLEIVDSLIRLDKIS